LTAHVWVQEIVETARTRLHQVKGGKGEPLLILYGEMGYPSGLRFHQAPAPNYTLHPQAPPGFGKSERVEWIMHIRDLAGWYLDALDGLGLGPVNVVSFSLGGWLAAEMATSRQGLYITRFIYTRLVHSRGCVMTGMARDGTFLIENGELSHGFQDLGIDRHHLDDVRNSNVSFAYPRPIPLLVTGRCTLRR